MQCSMMHPCKRWRREKEKMLKMTKNPAKTRDSTARHRRRWPTGSARTAVYMVTSRRLVFKNGVSRSPRAGLNPGRRKRKKGPNYPTEKRVLAGKAQTVILLPLTATAILLRDPR